MTHSISAMPDSHATTPPLEPDSPRESKDGAGNIPKLPPDATAEEKDLHWLRYVYQGHHQKQLTWRAVLMGGVLGMLLSLSNLYTTLKIGWAFGVAITACVMSYLIWNAISALTKVSKMTILENNCMQSTASAAGYSTGGTVGSALAALFLVQGHHLPWPLVVSLVFLSAALGVFLAIPMKRQMINHEQLAFPSGIAAAETLRSLYSTGVEAIRKAWVLVYGLAASALFTLMAKVPGNVLHSGLNPKNWLYRFCEWLHHGMPIKELYPLPAALQPVLPGAASKTTVGGVGLDPSFLMIGAGMIMGLRVSLSMLAGSVLLTYVLTPILVSADLANLGNAAYNTAIWKEGAEVIAPRRWGVWGGTAIMVIASLLTLALDWKTVARSFRVFGKRNGQDSALQVQLDAIEVPGRWLIVGLVPITLGTVATLFYGFGINFLQGLLVIFLTFILALVACRATGETDTTPIGAMGKVTQLIFAGLSPKNTVVNLMSAGTTSAAAGSAADLLTDLKSGYLLGANPRKQFLAQFFGIFFGTLAIVPAWYLMIPDKQALEKYPLPAATTWKAMADLLNEGPHKINYGAVTAIIGFGIFGALLVLLERLFPKAKKFLPSAIGIGLGMVVELSNALGFTIGAAIALIWRACHKKTADNYSVPLACGVVAGEGLLMAIVMIYVAAMGIMAR